MRDASKRDTKSRKSSSGIRVSRCEERKSSSGIRVSEMRRARGADEGDRYRDSKSRKAEGKSERVIQSKGYICGQSQSINQGAV
ncbi:hypothetical protein CWO07_17685 [Vibrio splendidus]|uniref:Uncharacterized protein n=1 Tax=Vibrio splendidus TaxID=29497 RepID=A0A2T5ESG6_VIBSP|nr:hypothetical protein BCU63_03475 [Vibrio splendidus]PMJ72605.1 hypothetical protein BCU23_16340 [Vibrio splendidus]PTP29346.1 hypothetical protein CWO07_17685 [Vibrio splendidus]